MITKNKVFKEIEALLYQEESKPELRFKILQWLAERYDKKEQEEARQGELPFETTIIQLKSVNKETASEQGYSEKTS